MPRAVVLLLLAVLAPGAAGKDKKSDPSQIGNREVGKGVNFYSIEKEIALGRQLAAEVEREALLTSDPLLAEFVNRLGQNLVRNSDAKVPFTFKVIQAEALNAFALPGGYIFVNTGLVRASETEAELASALAHEIAHVAGRHMTRQATRRQLADLLLAIPAGILGGWTGYGVRQGAGMAIPMTFLKLDRGFEEEADYLGVQYLYAAGYDPNAAVDLFERMQSLERRKPGSIAQVFASHPLTSDRLRKVQEEINSILPQRAEYVINTSEYIELRARLLRSEARRRTGEQGPVLRRRELIE